MVPARSGYGDASMGKVGLALHRRRGGELRRTTLHLYIHVATFKATARGLQLYPCMVGIPGTDSRTGCTFPCTAAAVVQLYCWHKLFTVKHSEIYQYSKKQLQCDFGLLGRYLVHILYHLYNIYAHTC